MAIQGISRAGIAGTLNPDLFRFSGTTSSYPNPMYRFIHTFIPGNLLELFSWCEFIYNNSPQLATSIRRFSEFPVTEVVFAKDDKHVKKYKEYFEAVDIKDLLMSCGIDFHVYGNAFVSPFYPFKRFLVCSKCKENFSADKVKYTFKSTYKFILTCPECNNVGEAIPFDRKIRNARSLKWIRWSPKDIELEFNSISAESKYHLNVPKQVAEGVRKGNLHIINSTPLEFIEAIRKNKRFCFTPSSLYHMKAHSPSGFVQGWGFPLLTQALYEVLHISVLKRANEAIAWEHIVPRLIVSPAPGGTSADPLKHIGMSKWKNELANSKDRWNKDPNYVMFAPFPINVQQLGGNGRALMVSAEIEAAEKNLAMALGIPLEFAAGTLAWQTSAMSLRLLKNQMHTLVEKLERLLQWIVDSTAKFLHWPSFKVSMVPFELEDDQARKQVLMQLNNMGKVSDNTLFTALGLDYDEELSKLKEEKLKLQKHQKELELAATEEQKSITDKAKREEAMGPQNDPYKDIDTLYAEANQMANLLAQQTPVTQKQVLDKMKLQNPPLHAMTYSALIDILEAARANQEQIRQAQTAAVVQNSAVSGTGVSPQSQQGKDQSGSTPGDKQNMDNKLDPKIKSPSLG